MKSQITELLKDLISFESTAGHKELHACADFIERYYADTDLIVKRYEHNGVPSVVVLTEDTLCPDIMMQGHFDVVPGGNTHYEAKIDGDYLYGPGALDMKGSVAAMMVVLRELATANPDKSIGLMLNGDEESGGWNSAEYLVQEVGYTTKLLINLDGGYSETISHAEKGIIRLELTAREDDNTPVHMPWLGGNAIDKLVDAYIKLRELLSDKHKATADDNWYTTYNAWELDAHKLQSRSPHTATMKLSMHFVEDMLVDDYVTKIQNLIPEVEVKKLIGAERVFVERDNPTLLEFKSVMDEVFERDIPMIGENGSSDARFFTHLDIPIIVTRPAGDDAEGVNERVSLTSLDKTAQVLKKFIEQR